MTSECSRHPVRSETRETEGSGVGYTDPQQPGDLPVAFTQWLPCLRSLQVAQKKGVKLLCLHSRPMWRAGLTPGSSTGADVCLWRKEGSFHSSLSLSAHTGTPRRLQGGRGRGPRGDRGATAGENDAPSAKRHLLGRPRTEPVPLSASTEARTRSYQVHPYGGGHRRLDLRAHILDEGVLVLPVDDHLGPGGGHQEGVVLLFVDVQDDLQAWAERAARRGQRLGQRAPGTPTPPVASEAWTPRPRHFRQVRGGQGGPQGRGCGGA